MATWQFWTLIGVLSLFGIYGLSYLWSIHHELGHMNRWLGMIHERLSR